MCTSQNSTDLPMDNSGSDDGSEKNDSAYQSKIISNNEMATKRNTNTTPSTIVSLATRSSDAINEKLNNGVTTLNDEFDEIKHLFDTKFSIIEKWLREKAPREITTKIHDAIEDPARSPKIRTSSVTSDLFQQWLASSPIQVCY